MKKCLITGSFAPFTIGHYNLMLKACADFDVVYIKIGKSILKAKMFDPKQMQNGINFLLQKDNISEAKCIKVDKFPNFSCHLAKKLGCDCLIRGIRNKKDLKFEERLAKINLFLGINTLFYIDEDKYSSTKYKTLKAQGKDTIYLLPEGLKEYLVEK